jgi:predicted RNase H-like nuclease (RuvC/YqgF family)
MERVIERLELDRDLLHGETKRLEVDVYSIGMNMGARREYVTSLKREIKNLGKTYQTLLNLSKKIPGLKPALEPVQDHIIMKRRIISAQEDEIDILVRSYRDKNVLLKDMRRDQESIQLYLDSRDYCQEKGLEYDISDEKVFICEVDMEADNEKSPIQRVG